eukprot:3184791-Rhodomonas_salina.7
MSVSSSCCQEAVKDIQSVGKTHRDAAICHVRAVASCCRGRGLGGRSHLLQDLEHLLQELVSTRYSTVYRFQQCSGHRLSRTKFLPSVW